MAFDEGKASNPPNCLGT